MTQANVLLVDDRPENLLALRAILEPVGCRLVDAHSGMEALKHLLQDEFALILMDVQMPGLDGFETTTLIKERERTRHIPIIFVTAISKEQNYIFQGYSAGAVDYISKPFDPVILRSKVMVFIELWAKTEQIKQQAEMLRRNEQLESEREKEQLELDLKRSHLAEIAESQADLERFKATLDATLDGVSIFDASHLRYSYVNQGALKQLGYEREEMLGMSALDVKRQYDEKKFRRLLKPLLAGQKQSLIYETLHRRKNGEDFPVEVFVQYVSPPFNAPPEEMGGFISISRDITERRRAQELLISAKETAEAERANAERANRAKSEFIAGISHELRTPLNAIIGFSKLLLNPRVGPLNEDQTAYTQDVVQSAEHLLELINDILDLSKIEAGKMALELSSFPFAHLIEQSLTIVRQKALEKGVDLSVKLPHDENIPTEIIGDARKIKQVMYNLLSNAVKFTPSGGTILVSARYEERTT
ncbi:MAG: response regulator, partial [Armatimonadetes bacterium]|nr:response regulator [Armatimonadota bacterium]